MKKQKNKTAGVKNEDEMSMAEQNANTYHIPVLYAEVLKELNIKPGGVYVDCTFGGGSHSKGILNELGENGKLLAFDQDADAIQNLPQDERIIFIPENFRHLHRFLRLHKISAVNGILADLGVSSHQFNEPERGFSIRFNGPLDMRMDQRQQQTAINVLRTFSETQLHKMFEQYGEVTNSKTLARHIVQHRSQAAFNSLSEFKALLQPVLRGNPNKYLAQIYQALRIEVNDEMGALNQMLQQIPDSLKTGGRAVIITFHSVEDRIVKNFFRQEIVENDKTNPFEQHQTSKQFKIITKKPLTPSDEELKRNPRARSAKMRVAEKL